MEWVKKNKLAAFLIVVVVYILVIKPLFNSFFNTNILQIGVPSLPKNSSSLESTGAYLPSGDSSLSYQPGYAPSESKERLVVEESSLSLVVKDVREASNQIVGYAQNADGFMVSSSLSKPEEAPFATVVVRVPSEKFREALDYFRSISVKVSSENIIGNDVTSEYEDLEARLATYEKTKTKFEEILQKSISVQDILTVQRELVNLQAQIDSVKGRQKYLEQTAKLAKITAYLSTDEWSLPYAPAKPFRPGVIFKQAIRSLVLTLRGLAEKLIWLVVYSVIWGPILAVVLIIRKRVSNKVPKK